MDRVDVANVLCQLVRRRMEQSSWGIYLLLPSVETLDGIESKMHLTTRPQMRHILRKLLVMLLDLQA